MDSTVGTSQNGQARIKMPWTRDDGCYRELGEVGSGAYGVVVKGVHIETGNEVAIKKIQVKLSAEGVPQSVMREIALLKMFEDSNHPNIIKLYDVCHGLKNDREMYINLVFEFCPFDLCGLLENYKPNPPILPYIKTFIAQILNGLDYLHSNGVVRRDLKPQNILVHKDGRLKLTDFGLARTHTMLAVPTPTIITLWYRPPEVILQTGYNTSVDMFSAGCIFAEMYLLSPLFKGRSEKDQLQKIFQIIGLPPLSQWPQDALISRDTFPHYPKVPLLRVVPGMCQLALNLLEFQDLISHKLVCDLSGDGLYLVGGWKSGAFLCDNFVRDVWKLNFSARRWTRLRSDDPPATLANHTLTCLDSRLLLIYGGSLLGRGGDSLGNNNETFIYDTLMQTWTRLATQGELCLKPSKHWFGQAMRRAGSDLYVATGRREHQHDSKLLVHKLDLHTLQWVYLSKRENEPSGRVRHEILMHEGQMMVIGGAQCSFDATYSLDAVMCFDPRSSLWYTRRTVPDPKYGYPGPRACHTLVEYNGDAYMCGGYQCGTPLNADGMMPAVHEPVPLSFGGPMS